MKKKRTDRTGKRIMTLGLLMIVAALALLQYNRYQDRRSGEAADLALLGVKEEIQGSQAGESHGEVDKKQEAIREIDGHNYLGYVSIPKIEMEWPIMSEWSYERLRITPCRHFGSYITDNMVLAGHNNDLHFGKLAELEMGDLIFFTDMDGDVYAFRVSGIESLDPSQAQVIRDRGSHLTLYTCTYSRYKRITIFSKRLEDWELEELDYN